MTADGESTATGSDGVYELADLASGDYDVTVDAEGYVADTHPGGGHRRRRDQVPVDPWMPL